MNHARTLNLSRLATLGFAALALAFFLAPKPTHAMTISPPVSDFTVNPGDVIQDVIHVYNEDPFPLTLRPTIYNFTFKEGDEFSGTPDFYAVDEVRNGHELAPWISIDHNETFVLQPQERINIPFVITVPKDATPGGHFGAIHIGLAPTEKEGDEPAVGILASTSSLVFIRVSGDLRDELQLMQFGDNLGAYSHLPVQMPIRFQNTGTTHLRPTGNVLITDMWGKQVASLLVNPGPDYKSILPGMARRFDVSWSRRKLPSGTSEFMQQIKNFAFGPYTATMLVNYSPENRIVTGTYRFWVIPWMALGAIAALIVLGILLLTFGARGYNRMVIRRYEALKKQGKL